MSNRLANGNLVIYKFMMTREWWIILIKPSSNRLLTKYRNYGMSTKYKS